MNLNPYEVKKTLALSDDDKNFITNTRLYCKKLFIKRDKLILFTGPCSIHNTQSTLEYAKKLASLAQTCSNNIFIIMRCFIEKSRTGLGWSGLVNDPFLDNSQDLYQGILMARKLLISITKLRLPICTEIIDPMLHPYFDDLISWGFIGARSSNSQVHRKFVSGLDIAVGFKNDLNSDFNACINALKVAQVSTRLIETNECARHCIKKSMGNEHCHIVLRGGHTSTNYNIQDVQKCLVEQKKLGLSRPLVIDCAHGNSNKTNIGQIKALHYIIENWDEFKRLNIPLLGIMLESFLEQGSQTDPIDPRISITDPCLDFKTTALLIHKLNQVVSRSPSEGADIHRQSDLSYS